MRTPEQNLWAAVITLAYHDGDWIFFGLELGEMACDALGYDAGQLKRKTRERAQKLGLRVPLGFGHGRQNMKRTRR